MDRMDEARTIAKAETERRQNMQYDYSLHFVPIRDYAVKLAEITGADKEVVELAAWLHDLGRVRAGTAESHHVTGAQEARNIMKNLGYPEKTIKHVEDCILEHTCEPGLPQPKTLESRIVSSADAMAHYDTIPWLLSVSLRKHGGDMKQSVAWVLEKVNRGWEKKILIPEGKKIVEEKYKAAKLLLESTLALL